jgi:MbtH protein
MNHEAQYSLWPSERDLPPGWTDAGVQGSRADCLAFVERTWTDMRPMSLRKRMGEST